MKRHHAHIPLLAFAAVLTLMVAALYAYMFHATEASVSKAALARDIVRVEKADQSQAKSLSELATSTAADRAQLASFFVPAGDVVAFITALESLGPQSGSAVSLASISADSLAGAAAGTIGSAQAHIDAHGSWTSVMRALSLAERMPYAVSLDHVDLNASSGNPASKETWQLSFDIRAAELVAASSTSL